MPMVDLADSKLPPVETVVVNQVVVVGPKLRRKVRLRWNQKLLEVAASESCLARKKARNESANVWEFFIHLSS